MRVWIDTDVGDDPDDAVALLCARSHPAVDLVGVSVVGGEEARRIARAQALVPVPVTGGDNGFVDAVRDAAPDALLAIGPLTNVAALLAAGVTVPTTAVMGGLLDTTVHRGARRHTEHNFSQDPDAAARVLHAAAPVLLVPLDVTVSMRLDAERLDELLQAAPTLRPDVESWLTALDAAGVPTDDRAVCLHDPLALLALVEPALVRIEARRLRVESDGQVVEDRSEPDQQVVRGVDADRALDRILEHMARSVG